MPEVLSAFTVGLLAANSPCVLPLYPGFLAYVSGTATAGRRPRAAIGVLVLSGVLTTMLALGAGAAYLGVSQAIVLSVLVPVANLALLILGVLLLADRNPFKMLPQMQIPGLAHPYANAFLYGVLYGPLVLPCSAPLVVSIFALSFSAGEALGRLYLFFWFGLGLGLPLLILSLLSAASQRRIVGSLARSARALNSLGGIVLIAAGLYSLWTNWPLIRLTWGF